MAALLIVVPLLAVVLLNLPPPRLGNKLALWLAGAVYAAQIAVVLAAPDLLRAPLDLALRFGQHFTIDSLALVMFLTIGIVGLVALFVCRYSIASEETRFRFGSLLLLALAGMNGIVLAWDLFALYVFVEITAVASFILIALERGRTAFEGAFKYLVLSAVATTLMLAGIALLFMVAGGTGFDQVAAAVRGAAQNKLVLFAIAMYVGGLSIKAGVVPFHGWLPDAYSAAPAAVSVLLAGIVTKVSGVYTLIRLVDSVFGYSGPLKSVLLLLGSATILVGALAALGQRDLKRMLAYSSISQVGYIILGLGAGTPLGIAGAVLHLFNHSIFKSLLFVNSAAVEKQSGTTDMDRLGGIGGKMPVTGATSLVGILSTAGIPPLSGFWSKLFIIIAVWQAGYVGYAVTAVLASAITLAYFLSMQRRLFFGKVAESCAQLKEANAWALLPAILLAAITVILGLGTPWMFESFLLPVRSML